jgi:hypothetical protein
MTATTTAVNACNVSIHLANASGTLIDISGQGNRFEMSLTQEVETFRVFGSKWMQRLACAQDATMRLDAVYSTASGEALALLRDWYFDYPGTTRRIRVFVPGDTTGADSFEADVLLTSLTIPLDASSAAPIMVSAEIVPNGEVTHATTTT